jgi:hypothetical protein
LGGYEPSPDQRARKTQDMRLTFVQASLLLEGGLTLRGCSISLLKN